MHPYAALELDHLTDDTDDLATDETYAAWCDERRDACAEHQDDESAP